MSTMLKLSPKALRLLWIPVIVAVIFLALNLVGGIALAGQVPSLGETILYFGLSIIVVGPTFIALRFYKQAIKANTQA